MKKFVIAALAASILATPVVAAPYHADHGRYEQRHDVKVVKKVVVRKDAHHAWRKGDRFDRRYASNYRVISSPRAYRLHDAPRGYRWVQSGNDAVLIGITSGVIAAITANVIR